MALFKVNRGTSVNLPAAKHDGWAYFCTDTAEFFIDYLDENEVLQRKQISADEAKKLANQIDWFQNDETAPDYIKNRPGGYIDDKGIVPIETKYITAISESNKGLEQKFWRGTKAEYDAISVKDDATLYIVTDNLAPEENSGGLPSPTFEDEGKFLRVINGAPAWATIQNAEEVKW